MKANRKELHSMDCNTVIKQLNQIAPERLACEWDNVGLLLGERTRKVKKIVIGLELTDEVAERAVLENADMIITHHPMLFSAIKRITDETPNGRRIIKLLQNKICYYAMHTNFDASEKGMAYLAAEKLGLDCIEVLDEEVIYQDETGKECKAGIGRIGQLKHPTTLEQFSQFVKQIFGNKVLTIYASKEQMHKMIHTVSIVPGSGKEYMDASIKKGADVLITGDINHHIGLDAMDLSFPVIDAGHYRTEQIFIAYMMEYLQKKLGDEVELIAIPVREPFQVV